TASADKTAGIWDVSTGKELHALQHDRAVAGAGFSPDGALVVTWSGNAAFVWSTSSGKLLHTLRRNSFPVVKASFSPDGRLVLTAGPTTAGLGWRKTGRLFSLTGPAGDPFLRGPTRALTSATFAPDGRRILISSLDGTIRTYVCTLCGRMGSLIALADARLAGLRG